MQGPRAQYHGTVGQGGYPNPGLNSTTEIHQRPSNSYAYHSSYSSDAAQYQSLNPVSSYNGHQMSYNAPYQQHMNQDMYHNSQNYGRPNHSHYNGSWDQENQQTYNGPPPPMQNGSSRNDQIHMPPPNQFSHHQPMPVSSPSHSPRSWSGVVHQHSPRGTPSPMAMQGIPSPSLPNRSPSRGKQFSSSPVINSANPSFDFPMNQNGNAAMSPASQTNTSSPNVSNGVDSNDPLQSLQKMVMIESQPNESSNEHSNYEISSNSNVHDGLPLPKGASDYSCVEQLASNELADSPGPTYYNLDDGKTVNSKLCVEETSRGSYSSEPSISEHHFSSVPPIEQMGYNEVNGISVEANTYHPPNHNGYPQLPPPPSHHMFHQNPYDNNAIPQKPSRKKCRKNNSYVGEFTSTGKKRKKVKPQQMLAPYNLNYYPNGIPSEYGNSEYDRNVVGPINDVPMYPNANYSPVVKKRSYTKRAKPVKKEESLPCSSNIEIVESKCANSNEKSGISNNSDDSTNDTHTKKNGENESKLINGTLINGRVSPVSMSISSFDGPVKITKVPNIIGKEDKSNSDPDSTFNKNLMKRSLIKEVSVKIVPLSTNIDGTIISSESSSSRYNSMESESATNSPCSSSVSSMPVTGHQEAQKPDVALPNGLSDLKRKRGRPKKGEQNGLSAVKKSKNDDRAICNKLSEFKKTEERSRSLFGPYIHLEGNRENPSSITIVNTQLKDDEIKDFILKKKKSHKHLQNSFNSKQQLGHSSTLSAAYDTTTKDKSWLCVLCHKGSHCDSLGDLFGPYYHTTTKLSTSGVCSPCVKNSTIKLENENSTSNMRSTRPKRLRTLSNDNASISSKDSKQGISKEVSENSSNHCSVQPSHKSPKSPSFLDNHREFWIHEDCITWANGVYINGHKVIGVEEAVKTALETNCSKCGLTGATLGCMFKGCPENLHFMCAKEKGCKLDDSNFSVHCPKHLVIRMKERS